MKSVILIFFLCACVASQPVAAQKSLSEAFLQLDKSTVWKELAIVPVNFNTYHPQGFALVGDHLFVSSVEVTEQTRRYTTPENGMDRSEGTGKGHLFKMNLEGQLLGHIELGEGAKYHPGGMDYDGTALWVPVAEYRPNSTSVIYRVNPESLAVREILRYDDHIGGVVYNRENNTLFGVSWGARRFYTWHLGENLDVTNINVPPAQLRMLNPSHYIDYQDCRYADNNLAICTGLATYGRGQDRLSLGGMELVDLLRGVPVHQVPFSFWTEQGKSLMQNPVTFELTGDHLRVYAMPEDNQSRLFIYETEISTGER